MARAPRTDSDAHNQIAKGTTIKGDIETEGVLRIEGVIIGSIKSKGKVVIGPTGRVEGDVICQSANLEGELKGLIKVSDLLSLQSTAKLNGEVYTGKLSIEPGAVFNAKCQMGAVIKELNHESSKSNKEKERQLAHAE